MALTLFGVRGGPLDDLFAPSAWSDWLASVDRPFLFLLLLPLVVVAFGLWADSLERARRAAARNGQGVDARRDRWTAPRADDLRHGSAEADRTRPESAA